MTVTWLIHESLNALVECTCLIACTHDGVMCSVQDVTGRLKTLHGWLYRRHLQMSEVWLKTAFHAWRLERRGTTRGSAFWGLQWQQISFRSVFSLRNCHCLNGSPKIHERFRHILTKNQRTNIWYTSTSRPAIVKNSFDRNLEECVKVRIHKPQRGNPSKNMPVGHNSLWAD